MRVCMCVCIRPCSLIPLTLFPLCVPAPDPVLVSVCMLAKLANIVHVCMRSTGVNACLRATCVNKECHVLLLECAYPMVTNTARAMQLQGLVGDVAMAPVSWPIKAASTVVDAVNTTLAQFPPNHFTIAIFSHIVSHPAATLPVEELCAAAKRRGVSRVVIDGAHTPGQIPVDVAACFQAGADAYIGNCHKWLFAPKAVAVMCLAPGFHVGPSVVSSRWHQYSQPQETDAAHARALRGDGDGASRAPIAAVTQTTVLKMDAADPAAKRAKGAEGASQQHGAGESGGDGGDGGGDRRSQFAEALFQQYVYTGTRDYTSMCCVSEGIRFHASLGGSEHAMQRNMELAQWACERFVAVLGTEAACPPEMQGCMFTVRLPSDDEALAARLYGHMMTEHNTSVAPKMTQGKAWLRISVQAYIDKADLEACAQHVLQFYQQNSK